MMLEKFLKEHPKKFIIFDLDLTIVKLRLPWRSYMAPVKEKLMQIDPSILDDYYNGRLNLSQLQNKYVERDKKMAQFFQEYNVEFESQLEGVDPNQNLIDFISQDKTHKKFIWSSNTRPTVNKALDLVGIADRFEKMVTRSEVILIKPDPEGFFLLPISKTDFNDCLFIGDSSDDEGAAKNLGIDFLKETYFTMIS